MAENFPRPEELNRYLGTGSTERPKPVEPKSYTLTHNHNLNDKLKIENFKGSKGEPKNYIQWNTHNDSCFFQHKLCRSEDSGIIY